MRTHYRACNLCEAICGLEITVENDRVTDIRGDKADPLSRGYLCPKATALADLQDDPDRLRRPLLRDGGGWREIGWDEAFDYCRRTAARGAANVTAPTRSACTAATRRCTTGD